MDKYTYSLKTDKIQKLVRQRDFATAAKIADTMEWTQEHNVRLLTAVGEAYAQEKRYSDATDILLRAYENSTAGKRILYRLTEMALDSGNMNDAETFYKKYLEEASEDNDRYLLRFRIAEAKGEALDRQITILETYEKNELEEEWACKLAELYQKAGRREDCIALCDRIILWFGVGPYVDRAMDLKEFYEPLTATQQEHRANRNYYEAQLKKVADEMETAEVQAKAEPAAEETEPADAENTEAPAEKAAEPGEKKIPAGYVAPVTAQERRETEERMANHTAGVDLNLIQEEMAKVSQSLTEEDRRMSAVAQARAFGRSLDGTRTAPVISGEKQEEDAAETPQTAEENVPAAQEDAGTDIPDMSAETSAEPSVPAEDMKEAAADPAVVPAEVSEKTESAAEIPENTVKVIPDAASSPAETSVAEPSKKTAEIPAAAKTEEAPAEKTEKIPSEESAENAGAVFERENCLFVTVASGQDGIELALDALEDYYEKKDLEMAPIAKILAEKLNRRGLIHSLPQLNHKNLIIDQAGGLSDTMIREMLEILDYLDTEKVFVLLDKAMALRELKQRIRVLSEEAEHEAEEEELPKIRLTSVDDMVADREPEKEPKAEEKPEAAPKAETSGEEEKSEGLKSYENLNEKQELSEKDFIGYAEHFAKELECFIDDSGMDALEEEMRAIRRDGGKLTVGEAEALIEEAADNAEKLTVRRMFSSKYNKEGYLILRKRNFR